MGYHHPQSKGVPKVGQNERMNLYREFPDYHKVFHLHRYRKSGSSLPSTDIVMRTTEELE